MGRRHAARLSERSSRSDRATNNEVVTLTNPIHPRDTLTIFLTGLGVTSPAVQTGAASPSGPLASALLEPSVSLADDRSRCYLPS